MTYLIWPFRRRLAILALLVGLSFASSACSESTGESCNPQSDNYPECLDGAE